jgi:hypothetical protein
VKIVKAFTGATASSFTITSFLSYLMTVVCTRRDFFSEAKVSNGRPWVLLTSSHVSKKASIQHLKRQNPPPVAVEIKRYLERSTSRVLKTRILDTTRNVGLETIDALTLHNERYSNVFEVDDETTQHNLQYWEKVQKQWVKAILVSKQ